MTGDWPEEAFAAALASAPGLGPAAVRTMLATRPPSAAWEAAGRPGNLSRIWQRHEELGIEICWRGGPGYPERLEGDPQAPAVLFWLGDLAAVTRHPTVAVVGTRSPTRYGIGVAAQLGAELAAAGVCVVSGLALGIDGAAHEGAAGAGAPPAAVVAGGLDRPYPARHARLFERVADHGVVCSESPAGVPTEKWRFPVRNRLLAMLSDVVVVVESRHQGGSLHTVAAAAERGLAVGAVPGSIRSPASEGTNALLADGCFPVCSVDDVLTALSLRAPVTPGPPRPRRRAPSLAPADRQLLALLSPEATSLDQLVRRSGLEIAALCGGLERLAQAGLARHTGGWWETT